VKESENSDHAKFVTTKIKSVIVDLSMFASGHWRLWLTTDGYKGWVPYDTQVGDLLYVAYGSSVPFVLRPYNPLESGKKDPRDGGSKDRNFILIGT